MQPEYKFYEGSWTYRSFLDDSDISKEFNALRFGAGLINFGQIAYDQILHGVLDMGGDYKLALRGELLRNIAGITGIRWTGTGIAGTPTQDWVYDYRGVKTEKWTDADGQKNVIVGSVIRTVAHDGAPAGFVGSFYMVKH